MISPLAALRGARCRRAETIEGRSRPERRDPSNRAWRFRTIQSFCGTINMNSSGSHVHNSAHHGKTITRQRSREAFYQHKMPHNANVPKHKTGRSAHHGAFTLMRAMAADTTLPVTSSNACIRAAASIFQRTVTTTSTPIDS